MSEISARLSYIIFTCGNSLTQTLVTLVFLPLSRLVHQGDPR
jgi:hypothetical protein